MRATVESVAGSADPAPEQTTRRRTSRVSAGHLVIALAAIVAVVANYAALRAQDERVPVAVAARDVAAGDVLAPGTLTFTDVRADDALLATLLTPADLSAIAGQVATAPLHRGDLVRRTDLSPAAAPGARRAMSIPVPRERAAGGRIRVGDRIDVIEVRDGRAAYIVAGAEVLDVPDLEASAGLGGLRTFSVTVAVDDTTALRLALAERHGELHVVLATGAGAAARNAPVELDDDHGVGG